jgi:hypothetical protein
VARLLKLFKLLRVLRAGRIFKRLETTVVIHYGYMKLMKFFFMVIFSAHLMACAFRLVVGIEAGGLYQSNAAVDPQLETARFQPLSLPLDPSRKTGYKLCSFQSQLVPLRLGRPGEQLDLQLLRR